MIALARVDSRLIHGQVIEGWLPTLKVARIVVADDQAATHPLMRAAMTLAVPPPVVTDILRFDAVDFGALSRSAERTLLLFREPAAALEAFARGLDCPVLNLGNVHFEPGREEITASVFLHPEEATRLATLERARHTVDVRALPHERQLPFSQHAQRIHGVAIAP